MGNKGKSELSPLSPNSAHAQKNLEEKVLKFLQYVDKKDELSFYFDHNSSTCTIEISCNQIFEFSDEDLIMETCNMLNWRESLFLPAAHKFLRERAPGNDEMINKICLSFTGFPASVQKFPEFISNDHRFQHVQVFSSTLFILDTTPHGRLVIQMLIVALLEYHSKDISWNGAFSITDMVVIDWGHSFKQLKILKRPVEADKCMEAIVKDLQRVSELIIPYYKAHDGAMPVYFSQFKEDLDGVTIELVAKPWFREYLSSHVALMSSAARRNLEIMLYATARRNLEIMLYATYKKCGVGYIPFLLAKPTVYPNDWRKALMKLDEKDINGVLSRVYSYNSSHQVEIDQYDNSVCGLMEFKGNFLEQGGQGQVYVNITELELYAADMFSEFLPSLVFTLLKQGLMERDFRKAWEDFKESRSVKSDT